MNNIAAIIEAVDARFRSGNSVPVERAPIKADEWQAIRLAAIESAAPAGEEPKCRACGNSRSHGMHSYADSYLAAQDMYHDFVPPAGDGECCANSGTYACKCSQFTPAAPAGGGVEDVAEALWHRFGDDSRLTWDEEPEKAIYRDAAAQAIAMIRRLASGGGGELLAVRTMDDLRNAAAGADYYFRPVQMRPQDAREILARLASTRPAGGGASGADEGDIEAIAAEVELLFANPGNDGGDARRLADRIRRLASAGSARGIPWWELAREAADVLEAVGTSGVPLPDNWRWPLADELSGAAALASRTGSAPAPSGDDTERLDWIESQVKAFYGDGYTEPREAGFAIEWRQEKPNDYWPGLRAWIDAERARGDGLDFDLPAAPTQEPSHAD